MIQPVVRLLVPCEDARRRPGTNKFDILGVITVIRAPADAFPVQLTFSVYLCLTDGHGEGLGKIVVADDETDETIFVGEPHDFDFGNNPTALFAATIPVPSCSFPRPGLYRIDFVYNDAEVGEYFVHVRETP